MQIIFLHAALLLFLFNSFPAFSANMADKSIPENKFADEDELNLYCLKQSYPEITGLHKDPDGKKWLGLRNGARVLYDDPLWTSTHGALDVTVRQSMADIYPLEPERPVTPAGFAPGRKRSYALFHALYGDNPMTVQKNLQTVHVPGGMLRMSPSAAAALGSAVPALREIYASGPEMRGWLKPDGAYYWRKIAGEQVLSAHAFGIAFDIGVKKAPYWRWSSKRPHPLQNSYPPGIVAILENAGFIWGGKWHEYDLMHFEYRPELICKSRLVGH